MRQVQFKLLFPLLAILPGCVPGNHVHRPEVPLPDQFEGKLVIGKQPSDAIDHWWNMFGDPQLADLVTEALRNAPDARKALAVLDEARAVRAQNSTRFAPQGGITVGYTRQSAIKGTALADASNAQATFSPSWELGLFGQRAALFRQADANYLTAQFVFVASRQSLAGSVARSVLNVRGFAAQLADARETERIANELVRIAGLKHRQGLGAGVDVDSFRAEQASARASVLALDAQLYGATRSLLVILGKGTASIDSVNISPSAFTPPKLPSMTPAVLLARRPDVAQALARLQSASAGVDLDRTALLPSISLTGGVSASKNLSSVNPISALWSFGANLAIPILDRPRLLAQLRAQNARGEQAAIAYEVAVQSAYADAETIFATYTSDLAQLTELEEAERHAHAAYDAQSAGYRAGIVDLTTLLQSERTWRATHAQLVRQRTSTLADAVSAFLAMGGGWPSDLTTKPAGPISE